MSGTSLYTEHAGLRQRYEIEATLVFDTAWRIGSGREGETGIDLGVLLDPTGQPLLPGSTLKGKIRSLAETLAGHLGMTACQLQSSVSGVKCVSDTQYYKRVRSEYERAMRGGIRKQLEWIDRNTCDVCKLFGSPVRAARIKVSDAVLQEGSPTLHGRDGVVLDRDSRTAVPGLKYDYEVVAPEVAYAFRVRLDNPTDRELALIGAVLFQMADGEALGGFVSRGLGRFRLTSLTVWEADLQNPEALVRFLTGKTVQQRMTQVTDWEQFFADKIRAVRKGV